MERIGKATFREVTSSALTTVSRELRETHLEDSGMGELRREGLANRYWLDTQGLLPWPFCSSSYHPSTTPVQLGSGLQTCIATVDYTEVPEHLKVNMFKSDSIYLPLEFNPLSTHYASSGLPTVYQVSGAGNCSTNSLSEVPHPFIQKAFAAEVPWAGHCPGTRHTVEGQVASAAFRGSPVPYSPCPRY